MQCKEEHLKQDWYIDIKNVKNVEFHHTKYKKNCN